ncbi:isopeptide-forming domain-containing fimbrial protein [Clostridium baratii]|uniref:isopeptide-forming domain-containing fimbrial protein n=1 Tax=Clostridium baratii TaxID=1561 RepID=UPI0030CDAE1F
MAKHKFLKCIASCSLLIGVMTTSFLPVIAQADNIKKQEVTLAFTTKDTPNGIADFGKGKASITINGNNGNQVLIGKKFNVYKLFNAQNSVGGESINYTLNPEYTQALKNVVGKKLNKTPADITEYEIIDYIQSLNNNKVEGANHNQANEGRYSDFRYFVEELRNEIVKLGIKSDVVDVTEVRKDNSIQLTGLDYGYYIVDEVSSVEGTHSASSLCMVNTANPNVTIQIKSDFPTVIKKIQEDDNIDSVGDNGWNDIGDYEIGQTVPYKFESNVPNMNGYNTYYYAWHDKMDEALTFHKDSVSIKISDENGKEYTLQNNEFNVIENPGNGETFKVEIRDIKAIVDREFNNKNALGENIYGQKVTLSYNATLNDKAANDTGRPGFENDVKLEFSNNPDSDGEGSTGETPWDTVVCFTYKINGLKTNDHNVKLEGAKFRLYSDKECKNEVFVKKSDKGYIVINRDSVTNGVPQEAVEMVSDENGVFTIIGLDQGTYYLKETQAPDGYRPLLDPIEIQVVPTFTNDRNDYVKGDGATDKTLIRLDATAKVKDFWGGIFNDDTLTLDTDVNEGSLNVTVVNKVGSKLPATGSVATLSLIGIGSALMTGSVLMNKKNKNKKDKEV